MARGGKRRGAGRPEALDETQRLIVVGEYEKRLKIIAKTKALARLDKRFAKNEIIADLDALQRIPLNLVRKSDGKSARELVTELANATDIEMPDDLPDWLIDAVHALRNRRSNLTKGQAVEPCRPPRGDRSKVFADLANWAAIQFGRPVSTRTIAECVRQQRALKTLL